MSNEGRWETSEGEFTTCLQSDNHDSCLPDDIYQMLQTTVHVFARYLQIYVLSVVCLQN